MFGFGLTLIVQYAMSQTVAPDQENKLIDMTIHNGSWRKRFILLKKSKTIKRF